MHTHTPECKFTSSHRNHFDRLLVPPPHEYYAWECGELRRSDRKGWASPKAGCPFHPSRSKTSFRVDLNSGAFYCHGCGAKGGDVIAFVMLRDHLDFKSAAKRLGAWRDSPGRDDQARIARARAERDRKLVEEQTRREAVRQLRIHARDELHASARLLEQISCDLDNDPGNESLWRSLQLAYECRQLDEQEYLRVTELEAYGL